ncbi:MAG TPA: nuclear transport factor 2 family protein [Kofleriaceae bacterium]|nr:nuclear transport factor 2 family protein [Kofleriaceae bacterium]
MALAADVILAVQAIVTRVAHTIDGKRWSELRALFADTVQTDYTSLFGGQVQEQRADDLMAAWQGLLGQVVTQHFLGPVEVEVSGELARAECHVRGYHVKKGAPGGDEWMVAGHYVFELERSPAGWLIRTMTLQALHQTGNLKLLG